MCMGDSRVIKDLHHEICSCKILKIELAVPIFIRIEPSYFTCKGSLNNHGSNAECKGLENTLEELKINNKYNLIMNVLSISMAFRLVQCLLTDRAS